MDVGDRIPHNRPWIADGDEDALIETLRSGQIGGGAVRRRVESELSALFGGGRAALVSSGTAGLYLALRALQLPLGSVVVAPTYSCVALLEAATLAGLRLVPADSRSDDVTIDAQAVLDGLADERPAAAIAVHQYGSRADVGLLARAVPQVIEDASQSLGTLFSHRLAHPASAAVVASFYATKVVTAGQGGAVWSRDEQLVERVRAYSGIANDRCGGGDFNFQLSDLAAALLGSQLTRLDRVRARRHDIAARFARACGSALAHQWRADDPGRLWYRFIIRLEDASDQRRLLDHLRMNGVDADPLLRKPQLLHRMLSLDPAKFPNAERLTEQVVSVPLHPSLSESEIDRIETALTGFRF